MVAALSLTCQNMLKSVADTGKGIGKGIYIGYDYVGRKIEHVTACCFGDWASGAITSIYWSLPYTVLLLHLPVKIAVIGSTVALAIWGGIGYDLDYQIGIEDRARMYRGIRNYFLIRTAVTLLELYATPQLSTAWYLSGYVMTMLQANTTARDKTPPQIVENP